MTFCSRIFIILVWIYFPLYGVCWPWAIVPAENKYFLVTRTKHTIRTRQFLKKMLLKSRIQYLFSDSIGPLLVDAHCNGLEKLLANARKKSSAKVKVLLAQVDSKISAEWHFVSPQGFIVQLKDKDTYSRKTLKSCHVTIAIKDGVVVCNGKRITRALRLRSLDGYGMYNGVAYDGDFFIVPYKDTFLCINQLAIEDYICSVLRTESWPGWPLEVNKVFAIACRSYVAFKALEAKRSGRPYDVKNTNAHQTYRGKHEVAVLKLAVEQTRGMVLGFKGGPILAMFDCCCGGIIPAHIADFDFKKVPYLARMYACHYCKQSSLYSWSVSYEHAVFEALLHDHLAKLSDIYVIKKDKAGLVAQVTLKGAGRTIVISGKKLYSMLKEVKSFHFDVHRKMGKIIFSGHGFGHHIGLCQWGACQMVRDGFDYKSILRFYYPGAYFMHLI
jgi:stage II sporulation protein D